MKKTATNKAADKGDISVELAKNLVWANAEEARKSVKIMMDNVDESAMALVKQLSHANDDATVQASFAIEAMVMNALQPNMEAERKSLAMGLAKALPEAKDDTSVCVVLQALRYLAVSETVDAIAAYLKKEPTFTYALMALRVINDDAAMEEVEKAAFSTKDKKKKAVLLAAALGYPKCSDEAVDTAFDLLDEGLPDELHRMLLGAFAVLGEEEVSLDLLDALESESKVNAGQARRSLRFLALTATSKDVANDFYAKEAKEPAFTTKIALLPESKAFDLLLDVIENGDAPMRACAMQYVVFGFVGPKWTEKLVAFAAGMECPAVKAELIEAMGKRGDIAARPFIMSMLNDKSPLVRKAALKAVNKLPGCKIEAGALAGIVAAGL